MIFGNVVDLRKIVGSNSSSLSTNQINIIETNLGTHVDVIEGYTEITWDNGMPSNVKKYLNNSKARLLYDIDITWVNGLPSTIISNNVEHATMVTTNITWENGLPTSITKI